jgi:cardiolipin synthase
VTVLLEEDPSGGIPDQEKYICEQLAAAGGACWFMLNDSARDIFDRYRFLHAKFILVDGERAVISSENLSPEQPAAGR